MLRVARPQLFEEMCFGTIDITYSLQAPLG